MYIFSMREFAFLRKKKLKQTIHTSFHKLGLENYDPHHCYLHAVLDREIIFLCRVLYIHARQWIWENSLGILFRFHSLEKNVVFKEKSPVNINYNNKVLGSRKRKNFLIINVTVNAVELTGCYGKQI